MVGPVLHLLWCAGGDIPEGHAPGVDSWPGYFADRGHPEARRIGAGVEGVVYGLGDGRVAKVWTGRPPSGLTRQVYADIAQHRLPFGLDDDGHFRCCAEQLRRSTVFRGQVS